MTTAAPTTEEPQRTFEYGLARASDLSVYTHTPEGSDKPVVTAVEIDGERMTPTDRFWTSFFVRFGFTENIFRYFDHTEVFTRISERAKSDSLRYCIERDAHGNGLLLGVSNPARPVVSFDEVNQLAERYGATDIQYHRGIITTTHVPRSGDNPFHLGNDEFQHRFVMDTPIDGYTKPKIHLSFLRMVCTNGMIGYSKAFRSELSVGDDVAFCLERALESYDNDDGYSALRQRFSSAQTSWASLHECETLRKLLVKLCNAGEITGTDGKTIQRFEEMTGNLHDFYGLANLDALSVKRQRVLPSKARVYDLLNYASELATHHALANGSRRLQAYLGSLISDEYDMEGTAEKLEDFRDLFMTNEGQTSPSVN